MPSSLWSVQSRALCLASWFQESHRAEHLDGLQPWSDDLSHWSFPRAALCPAVRAGPRPQLLATAVVAMVASIT